MRTTIGRGWVAAVLLLVSSPGWTQDRERGAPSPSFALPIELDLDYGASNGAAVISRYIPLVAFPLGERWRLINLTLAVVADAPGGVPGRPGNPEPVPGGRVFGLGDLTNAVFFTPPTRSNNWVWGFGPALSLPVATDARLGSGKWSAGPAFRFAYRPGPWNFGAVVVDLGSFAGDSGRGNIHQFLVRGLVRRQLGGGWYFTYNPIITANWESKSGQRWLVPVGGGLGKRFEVGSKAVALSAHYYVNVIKPEGAPDGLFRVDVVVPIPVSVPQQ
jgi:hypothetical protein